MASGREGYGWDRPEVRAALAVAQRRAPAVADLARQVAEIPAPTFHEEERAAFVRRRFEELGLAPEGDAAGNVVAARRGAGQPGALLLAAHTDTVFPHGTDLTVREQDGRLCGPGIGDNSLAVAALLTLPTILDEAGLRTGRDLLLCANTGEEGLGDLRGIKQAVGDRRDRLAAVIAVEGHNLGRVTHQAVGSRRLRITVEGPGGHSWGAFGNPNAIHVLGELIARIARLEVPREPKTTYNVGLVEGGVSVNTIAPRASLVLDLRSIDAGALERLVAQVEELARAVQATASDQITVRSEVIGDRPAGALPVDAPLVQVALATLRQLGVDPVLDASSTDANVPIALGIPAVCIGLTLGGNAHRTDEYIEVAPIGRGLQQLVLLVAALAGVERGA